MTSFTILNKNPFKAFYGEWKLIETSEYNFNPNQTYSISTKSVYDSNRKEYTEGLNFRIYNSKNENIVNGRWTVVENKIIETLDGNSSNSATQELNILNYRLNGNKLTVEYPGNKKNIIIKEVWKKIK